VLPFSSDDADPQVQAPGGAFADTLTSQLTPASSSSTAPLSVVPSSDVRQAAVTSAASPGDAGCDARRGRSLAAAGRARAPQRIAGDAQRVRQLRSFTLDEDASGLDLQDSVVERVARMLELELAPRRGSCWRRARRASRGRTRPTSRAAATCGATTYAQSLARALTAFQHALEIDPTTPWPMPGLAEAYWRRYQLEREPPCWSCGDKASVVRSTAQRPDGPVHVTAGQSPSARREWERAQDAL